MRKFNKIFCIGVNKTGTTSLHKAFQILGLKSVHFKCEEGNIKKIIEENWKNSDALLKSIDHYDVYSDWNNPTTNHLYSEFDRQYPESLFILNTRDMQDWIKSREKHVKRVHRDDLKELQEKYPNSTWLNIDKKGWKKEYRELHEGVLEYFKDRPEDLLVINVPAGEGWEKLCPFLEVDIPNKPFPNVNKAPKKKRLTLKEKLKRLFNKN